MLKPAVDQALRLVRTPTREGNPIAYLAPVPEKRLRTKQYEKTLIEINFEHTANPSCALRMIRRVLIAIGYPAVIILFRFFINFEKGESFDFWKNVIILGPITVLSIVYVLFRLKYYIGSFFINDSQVIIEIQKWCKTLELESTINEVAIYVKRDKWVIWEYYIVEIRVGQAVIREFDYSALDKDSLKTCLELISKAGILVKSEMN